MSKPAPGPYAFGKKGDRGGSNVQTICVMDANGRNIATVYGKENGEKHDTAKLLALSFDMFQFIKGIYVGGDPNFDKMEEFMKAMGEV